MAANLKLLAAPAAVFFSNDDFTNVFSRDHAIATEGAIAAYRADRLEDYLRQDLFKLGYDEAAVQEVMAGPQAPFITGYGVPYAFIR
jgi:hypothetical protein